ncbi:alpha-L-rhamnosidase C-terminal domain-containing protein [Metabacillus sp. Hm71]|uniref:alpha-L-rhamnosidase C-terminal domain-containing protein n=1 Tax=Metabacillus sp. Hm71 TaxID=3450743 RepID=UPI003F440F25
MKQDGTFWSDEMNSFNHYAYGAIGNWMYKVIAGLDMNEAFPAYKKIRIAPKFAGIQLTYAKASYESMYGRIRSSWRMTEEEIEMEVEIPANTTAEIMLPYAHLNDVSESGKPLVSTAGIHSSNETNDGVILTVGSGTYRFNYVNKHGLRPIFTEESRLMDLLEHEETLKLLTKYAPGITNPPGIFEMKTKSLQELADLPGSKLSTDKVNALLEELNNIEWNLVLVK